MTRFDDVPDTDEIETKSKKPKKTFEEELEDTIYDRRCKLVKLSNTSDIHKFMTFLRENEHIFKKADDYSKECMRRTCDRILNSSNSTLEDAEYCDRIFGPYIDPRHSKRIPIMGGHNHKEKSKTVEEEIAERSCGTYYAMWDFITNPEWQEKLRGRSDLYGKVKFMIDRAKENNEAVLPTFKTYESSDEIIIEKVLEMMKNEQND